MLSNNHDHTGDLVKWIIDHWVILGGTVSTMIGGITYILHNRFATIAALERCKEQTVRGFQKSIDEHEKRELEAESFAHAEIKSDIAQLFGKVGSVDDKVDQLKNMLLQKEWTNK